jgi:hypothetical protein
MMELPRYSGKGEECIKCETPAASTLFVPSQQVKNFGGAVVAETSEHLLRRCCNCGFEWKEATLEHPQ